MSQVILVNGKVELLIQGIKAIVAGAKNNMAVSFNEELLRAYWKIGRIIVERENKDAASERQFLIELSKKLTQELGKGFSRSNLFYMKKLYLTYPDGQTIDGCLSWSHYLELLLVEDELARSFYETECKKIGWSQRELKRQIDTSLFERLLLSKGDLNKQEVLRLSREGQSLQKPADLLKEPYVLEFLGYPENKPYAEKDLEAMLIRHIEEFLLELGRGFMFVGSQMRIPVGDAFHRVDMVFYNKILRAYVLLDLKRRKLEAADAGQMNFYLNYYKTEVNDPGDNPPIGIILCARKDEVVAEYALGGLENNVFASKYVLYLPEKEELVNEVRKVLEAGEKEE